MESILFNQLTESDYGQDNDELLLQQNGITKRIKSKNFFDGAIANAMHEKYTAGRLLVADDDGNIAESEKTEADLDRAGSAVTYTEQTLTDAQKAQARTNIGADTFVTNLEYFHTSSNASFLYNVARSFSFTPGVRHCYMLVDFTSTGVAFVGLATYNHAVEMKITNLYGTTPNYNTYGTINFSGTGYAKPLF